MSWIPPSFYAGFGIPSLGFLSELGTPWHIGKIQVIQYFFFFLGDAGCVTVHYTFETLTENRIYDTSNNGNHGNAIGDVSIADSGHFGKCLHVSEHANISLGSATFHNKPRLAITVSTWVKLASIQGSHAIFQTCNSGQGPNHGQGQYHFEVNDGKVRWFHRDHVGRTVFNVQAGNYHVITKWISFIFQAHDDPE